MAGYRVSGFSAEIKCDSRETQASQCPQVLGAVLRTEGSKQLVPGNQIVDRRVGDLKRVESENGDMVLSHTQEVEQCFWTPQRCL